MSKFFESADASKRIKVAPSLLSADFSILGLEIDLVTQAGADWIHVDVMDGSFVPNITIGIPVIKSIQPGCRIPLDVHLMIDEPERYIEKFIAAGAQNLTIHIESTKYPLQCLEKIRQLNRLAGLTLKPGTSLEAVKPFLNAVDLVLVMTVEPGFGGQAFLPEQVDKIIQLKQLREQHSLNYLIEVDGGINPESATICAVAGADVLVAGNAVFKGEKTVSNYQKNISALRSF